MPSPPYARKTILLCVLAGGVLLALTPAAGAQFVVGGTGQFNTPLSPVPTVDLSRANPAEALERPSLLAEFSAGPHSPGLLPLDGSNAAAPALALAPAASQLRPDYTPITGGGRFRWVMLNTFGLKNVTIGIAGAAISTARNKPPEWGPGWEGFGKRLGTAQATVLTSSVIEASVGALWGEDPRYLRSGKTGFFPRAGHAIKMAFFAYRRDGSVRPAYARFPAIAASHFISSTWRPPSDDDWEDTATRIGMSYLYRAFTNLWTEFWRRSP